MFCNDFFFSTVKRCARVPEVRQIEDFGSGPSQPGRRWANRSRSLFNRSCWSKLVAKVEDSEQEQMNPHWQQ